MKIAIQGARGSACEMAAEHLLSAADADVSIELIYALTAKAATEALLNKSVAFALLVLESPLGTAVPETVEALSTLPSCHVVASRALPVNHVLLGRALLRESEVTRILSHSVPLAKHANYLKRRFPNADFVPVEDTGMAACALAEGVYGETAMVVALPTAGTIYGLKLVCSELPGDSDYLSKFALVSLGV
jgi:prephenate dehydratase